MDAYVGKSAEVEEKINNKADKRNIQPLYETMYDYNARASELRWVLELFNDKSQSIPQEGKEEHTQH